MITYIGNQNAVSWFLLFIIMGSFLHGGFLGALGAGRKLSSFFSRWLFTLLTIAFSLLCTYYLEPFVHLWFMEQNETLLDSDTNFLKKLLFSFQSAMQSLGFFRFGVLFFVIYGIVRFIFLRLRGATKTIEQTARWKNTLGNFWLKLGVGGNHLFGALFGGMLGLTRAFLWCLVLYFYCTLFPSTLTANYIQQSAVYQTIANAVIKPSGSSLLEKKLPVFAEGMSLELKDIWQKRYDLIDANVPDSIVQAAQKITQGKSSDKDKARALYSWVGTRISYDDDKVNAYEQQGQWREQNPEKTFLTRKGVCIDFSRLYAVMARSVGLNARIVTGNVDTGTGKTRAHAWNEVYLKDESRWIPLDTTWAISGNWFDSQRFTTRGYGFK